MKIHIDRLEIECIIGLLDFERVTRQLVTVDIEADYEYSTGSFVDYSKIVQGVSTHLIEQRYELLEDALVGVRDTIFESFPAVRDLYIKIGKPDILPDCSVALSDRWTNRPL